MLPIFCPSSITPDFNPLPWVHATAICRPTLSDVIVTLLPWYVSEDFPSVGLLALPRYECHHIKRTYDCPAPAHLPPSLPPSPRLFCSPSGFSYLFTQHHLDFRQPRTCHVNYLHTGGIWFWTNMSFLLIANGCNASSVTWIKTCPCSFIHPKFDAH